MCKQSAHIFDDVDDEKNDDDIGGDDVEGDGEKKGANEAPTSFPPTNWLELRSTFGHQTDQTRPDCNESQVQSQNRTNTNRKYDKYKYKMVQAIQKHKMDEVEKHLWPSDRPTRPDHTRIRLQ